MNYKKIIKITKVFIVSWFLIITPFALAGFIHLQAQEIEITNDRNFFVEAVDKIRVVEMHTIKNNSTKSYLKQENTEAFVITHLKDKANLLSKSVASAKITAEGKNLNFSVEYQEDQAVLTVGYPRKIGTTDKLSITLEYENYGLIEKTGALYDIYASGLDKSTKFENENQLFDYNTYISINEELFPAQNFILPVATEITNVSPTIKKYYYNKQSILGKTIWLQMGTKQFYHFKLVQKIEPTMKNNLGLQNEYTLVLPRDVDNAEIYQKVYFDKILPLPSRVETDSDGNIIAHFNVPSVDSGEITVEGYVEVGLTGVKVSEENSGNLSDYVAANTSQYLKAAEFWEVDSSEIQKVAATLKSENSNVYKLISNIFTFVTDKIDYNEIKRFGLNERQGALETLKNGSGVCMEYSDLYITLARAQGIPTRAVFGYGYDPKEGSDTQESHQWVASLLPGLNKWLDVDVTWGDSGNVAQGAYLNHFYTHMVTASPNALPEIAVKSFGSSSNLALPNYKITAETELPKDLVLLSQEGLLAKYPNTNVSGISQWVLEIPLRIGAFFGNYSNKDALSIALFTVGFALVIVPVVLLLRKRIDFGGYKQVSEELTVTPEVPIN